MTMRLEKVIPWGRSKREYFGMFNLTDECFEKKILGCGDGPASFNAEMTASGGHVISCDPLYEFTGDAIYQRFELQKGGNKMLKIKTKNAF